MAASGFCPSGRFFEAAACGAPIITDWFQGLDSFFEPEKELLVANTAEEVMHVLDRSDADLLHIASRARQRTLDEHTGYQRALTLLAAFEAARSAHLRVTAASATPIKPQMEAA
jgi:spore maturation protein CgeB